MPQFMSKRDKLRVFPERKPKPQVHGDYPFSAPEHGKKGRGKGKAYANSVRSSRYCNLFFGSARPPLSYDYQSTGSVARAKTSKRWGTR